VILEAHIREVLREIREVVPEPGLHEANRRETAEGPRSGMPECPNSFDLLVRLAGIEPATFGFEVPFSHLLACHGRYHSIAPCNA